MSLDVILILSNLDALHVESKWNYYAKLGLGTGRYKAEQFLLTDDSPDDQIEDNFREGHIGIGVQYELNSQWRLELESNYTLAFTDGFDGFNNASGSDPYLTTGLGVAYTFGQKEKKATYQVNYFGPDYLNINTPAVAPEPEKVVVEDKVKEEELKKLEAIIKEQQKQINQADQALQNQRIKIDQLEKKREIRNGIKVLVFFEFDSSQLTKEAKKEIVQQLENQENKEGQKLKITAYADNNGEEAYNETLRQQRAEQVKKFLQQLGYNNQNISISTSKIDKKDKENQFLNRKVVIEY